MQVNRPGIENTSWSMKAYTGEGQPTCTGDASGDLDLAVLKGRSL